tara:strand:+ start:30402 stop:31712 length:1311 start_codon:yes stop_codon:yes gene_type:complete
MDKRIFPKRKFGYSAVAVMTLAQVFAFIDRQIPAMLVEPIKSDFGLSDSQIALLGGAAFSLFYAIMALPIGYAVDRMNRKNILGTGIFLWSLMTTLAAFSNSFTKLFGARVGVAVGEAVMAPTSVSLVSDYFPENKQGKPMGIITAGVYIGIGLTLLGGGFLIDYLTSLGPINIPFVGTFKPWQATFLIVGIPGILISIFAFRLREPDRELTPYVNQKDKSLEIISYIKAHISTFVTMFLGLIFMALIFYSFTFWAPTMMVRTHGLSLSEVGLTLGIITITMSILGTISAGAFVDFLRNKNYLDAPVRAALICCILAFPAILSAPLVDSKALSWLLLSIYLFFISSFAPLGLLAVSGISKGSFKGQLAAIHAFLMMAFGLTLGPQLTAFFTDFIFMKPEKLSLSISLTALVSLPLASLFFFLSMPKYRLTASSLKK